MSPLHHRLSRAALLLALACSVVIYWPGVHGGFVQDDYANIVENTALQLRDLRPDSLLAAAFSSNSGPLDRPLSMLSFALNEYFWGPGPYSMKVTNILIHTGNGLLVYAVAALMLAAYRRRFRPGLSPALGRWTAVAVTAAWLLLPINLTAVLYVVQRMTSLSGTFVLAGVALYLWGRSRMLAGRAGLWMLWVGIAVCGGLAVLAKESGALLPVYTLAIEWTLFGFARPDGRRDRRLYTLYALVLVLPGVLGLLWLVPGQLSPAAYAARPFTLGERLLTEARVVLDYIAWSLAPSLGTLSVYHDDFPFSRSLMNPPGTLAAIMGIVLLLAIAVRQRRRRPLLSLGILWFFGGQLLTATVFNLELVYEHRNYLPSLGLLLAVFALVLLEPPITRLAPARRALVIGMVVLYGIITTLRVQQWSDPIRYAVIAAAEHPNSPRATYALGRTYTILVDSPDSPFIARANQALETAAAVPRSSILPEQGLLILNSQQRRPLKSAWWRSLERKLADRPASVQDVRALNAMVYCELRKECNFPANEMMGAFASALGKNPGRPDLLAIYSNYALNILRDHALARQVMLETLRLAPRTPQYRINLIKLDIFLGRFDDARREIDGLRALNRLGNLDMSVREMEGRLAQTESSRRAHPKGPAPGADSPAAPGGKNAHHPDRGP